MFEQSDAAWELALPPLRKLVLLYYARRANPEGLAWPSIATVAAACCLQENTVRAEVGRLCRAGLLVLRAYGTGGRGRATVYNVMPAVNPPAGQEGIEPENTLPSGGSVSAIPSRLAQQYPPVGRESKHQEAKHQRARAREAVAARSTSPSRGAGVPTPITTQLVIDSIASRDPGLADVLRRNTPPPAGAAPSLSEPAAPESDPPEPPRR